MATYYSPAAIVSILNASIGIKEEKKIIQMRGIFRKIGTANYGGFYYYRLKDEASDYQITLVTPAILHNQLNDNRTIEFNAYINRRISKIGQIEIQINLIDLISQQANKYTEEDLKKLYILNKKIDIGSKDLDMAIRNAIFHNIRFRIRIILGKSAIIDHDIRKGMVDAIALYDISYHTVSITSTDDIIKMIKYLDNDNTDLICLARGGGENLSIFDNIEICEAALQTKAIIASAIGHDVDVTLFEKIADKKFSLPFHFGTYLKEIYNTTIEDFQASQAKMVKNIETRLNTEYSKKLDALNYQLTSAKQINEKFINDLKKSHENEVAILKQKLKTLEELYQKTSSDKNLLHSKEITNLKKEIDSLKSNLNQKDEMLKQSNALTENYKNQASNKSNDGCLIGILIVLIIVLIVLVIKCN